MSTTTVSLTSKRLKGHVLGASAAILLGTAVAVTDWGIAGAVLAAAGMGWMAGAKFRAWWQHG